MEKSLLDSGETTEIITTDKNEETVKDTLREVKSHDIDHGEAPVPEKVPPAYKRKVSVAEEERFLYKFSETKDVMVNKYQGKTSLLIGKKHVRKEKDAKFRGISFPTHQWSVFKKNFSATEEAIKHFQLKNTTPNGNACEALDTRSSSTHGFSLIETWRFDGRSYLSWASEMELFLKQMKLAYVLSEPYPGIGSGSSQDWLRDDYLCHNHLMKSLSDDLYRQYLKRFKHAKELWEGRTNQEALFATGINLTHVPQGGKNSTDRSLITEIMCWVSQNPPPAHLFLISSDSDFANVLHRLRMRNYNILLACYEETTLGVLCSAASIMWDWDALVRGQNPTAKHFNQPPDGPYHSWYGHYTTPLLDPFATSTNNKQISSTSVKTVELLELGSSKSRRPIPNKVVKQIGLILRWYPKGAAITELREQLRKRKVLLDRDFYGYKSFSRFLLSMRNILQVVPLGDGMFSIHAVTQGMDNKALLPKVSCENHAVVSVEKMCQNMKQNDKDVKEESHQLQESSQEFVQVMKLMDVKAKEEPVKANQLAITAVDDVSSFEEKDGFLKKLNRLLFGSPEMELEHLQERKHISGNGVLGEGKVVDKDLESQIASSTSSESAEEVKVDNAVGNGKSKSPGLTCRLLKRFKFSWGRYTELSNAAATGPQVDDVFVKDSFWNDVESFINSPRGFVAVSHSRSRETMAKNLKEEGPSSLKPLDVPKMLDLISMLISEKKWIQENPSDALPFRVTRFTEESSCRSNPRTTDGLRAIFVNMSESLCDGANGDKNSTNVGMSQKPKERSRSKVIADCHKLIKKITEENAGGYSITKFKKAFLEKFGYRLEYRKFGFSKLQSLIEMMPEARIESGHIVTSSTPVPCESDSSFEDLGPVSKKIHENESSVSEGEDYDSEMEEKASSKQSGGERKKKEDETESDLLQILGSWDTDKKPAKTFGEDKLVEGILMSLRKKPSGDSRIQD